MELRNKALAVHPLSNSERTGISTLHHEEGRHTRPAKIEPRRRVRFLKKWKRPERGSDSKKTGQTLYRLPR